MGAGCALSYGARSNLFAARGYKYIHRPHTLLLLLFLTYSAGCATIISGTSEKIRFKSTPAGAQVAVAGQTYSAPVEVRLSRKQNHDVEFTLPDHLPVKRQVLRASNPWVLGNVLIGGLIGLMVDYSSGAANDLEPDIVDVHLVPMAARKPETATTDTPPSDITPAGEPPTGAPGSPRSDF